MKQQVFEAERQEHWHEFDVLLEGLKSGKPDAHGRFPALLRQISQDLAIARDRMFTEDLIAHLNHLAISGHEQLYAAPSLSRSAVLEFVLSGFPRAVRGEARLVVTLGLLFFGSIAISAGLVSLWPDVLHSFLDPATLEGIDSMYGSDLSRDASEDASMFGFYVWNNVSIAFRMFAGGLLFGVGSLLVLVTNSVHIGLVTGYVIQQGLGPQFFPFVIGHSSLELTGIVLAAVAGLRMGLALIQPGRRSRRAALRRAAQTALPILYGTGGMIVLAAVIEGFWSAAPVTAELRYVVGSVLWLLVLGYLAWAGRDDAA